MLMQLLVESAPMRVDPDQQWDDEQLVEEFLREKGENSVHTREAYDRDLNQFRAFLLLEYGEKTLAEADAIAVDAYVVQLKLLAELGEPSDKKLPKQPIPIFKTEQGGAMNRDTVKGFS